MKQFYEKILEQDVSVLCSTKKQAKQLLKWADSKGLSWDSGQSFLDCLNWNSRGMVIYYLSEGLYSDLYAGLSATYEFEDVIIRKHSLDREVLKVLNVLHPDKTKIRHIQMDGDLIIAEFSDNQSVNINIYKLAYMLSDGRNVEEYLQLLDNKYNPQ